MVKNPTPKITFWGGGVASCIPCANSLWLFKHVKTCNKGIWKLKKKISKHITEVNTNNGSIMFTNYRSHTSTYTQRPQGKSLITHLKNSVVWCVSTGVALQTQSFLRILKKIFKNSCFLEQGLYSIRQFFHFCLKYKYSAKLT